MYENDHGRNTFPKREFVGLQVPKLDRINFIIGGMGISCDQDIGIPAAVYGPEAPQKIGKPSLPEEKKHSR